MPDATHCARCGAVLASFDGASLCPQCMVSEAVGLGMGADVRSPDDPAAAITEKDPAIPSETSGTRVGRYKLLERIGEGGMGAVWMAEQVEPVRRMVALKLIKPGMDSGNVLARFEAERQALALMDHPNIAKILDAGVTGQETRGRDQGSVEATPGLGPLTPDSRLLTPAQGRPYFVMELVKGIPITKFCDNQKLTIHERLELFMPVCQAIQHAHQKGVIHRDIKPSNVLVALYDGRPVPKVIDFGIAKATGQQLTERTLFTGFGALIGTPEYMSPEQAELNQLDIDTRSDIYSLGVLLYELLTGTTPLNRETLRQAAFHEILRRIREEEPPKPSTRLTESKDRLSALSSQRKLDPAQLAKVMQGDLDWIVMKALEKDRNRRYETASGVASDIQRHLNQEPVLACPPSSLYRFQKLVRRNKLAVAAAACVATILTIGVVVSTWQAIRATNAERNESRLRQQAEAQRENNRQRLVRTHVSQGAQRVEQGDYFGALPWFVEALNLNQGHPDAEEHHRMRIAGVLEQSPRLFHTWFHQGPVRHAEFSADGRSIVTASQDHTARVWDTLSGDCRAVFRHEKSVNYAAFSPDGERVVTACADGSVTIWDVTTAKAMGAPMKHERRVNCAMFSADGRRIISASEDMTARVWDAATGQLLAVALGHEAGVIDARFSPDGRRIATISSDSSIRIWDSATGEQLHRAGAFSRYVYGVRFSSDGRRLVAASWGKAFVLEVESGKQTIPTLEHQQAITSAVFSYDGKRILTASEDQTVRMWDSETGHEITAHLRHPHAVTRASFSPTGRWIITACDDGVARIWDAKTSEPVAPFFKQSGPLTEACFSPGGSYVLTAGSDGMVRLWDMASSQPRSVPLEHGRVVRHSSFSRDGRWILTASDDRTAQVWESFMGRVSGPRLRHDFAVLDGCFSPDGSRIATATIGGTAEIWDRTSSQQLVPPLLHTGKVVHVRFREDGRQVLTVSGSRTVSKNWYQDQNIIESPIRVQTWDVATGRPVTGSFPLENSISPETLSTDTLRIATACQDNSFRIWATTTGQLLATLPIIKGLPRAVTFSPDGRLVATVVINPEGGEVSVWESSTGRLLAPLIKHRKSINGVAFNPMGTRIITSSDDGTARIWDTETGLPTTAPLVHQWIVYSAEFSSDGRRVVTGSGDHTARVWDAQTGELIGPPYQHNGYVVRVIFSPDGHQILANLTQSIDVTRLETAAQLWQMPADSRSVEDLQLAAQILSSQRIDATSSLVPLEPETFPAAWSNYVQRTPSPKPGADEQTSDWHWRELERAEKDGQRSAVLLHAEQLMASGTNLTQGRRTEARLKLAKADALCKADRFEEAHKVMSELSPTALQAEAQTAGKVVHTMGRWAAGESRWPEAAAYYNILTYGATNGSSLESDRDASIFGCLEYAALLVTMGDTNRYLKLREDGLRHYGAARSPATAERMLIASLLWPLEPAQMAAMTNWATFATFIPQNQKSLEAWACAALALYEYRRGGYEKAVEWGKKCLSFGDFPARSPRAHVVLALAYRQLNQDKEAQTELNQCREIIESKVPWKLGLGVYESTGHWYDWLVNGILLREAVAGLSGVSPRCPKLYRRNEMSKWGEMSRPPAPRCVLTLTDLCRFIRARDAGGYSFSDGP